MLLYYYYDLCLHSTSPQDQKNGQSWRNSPKQMESPLSNTSGLNQLAVITRRHF